jgi:HK97 family phage prohead protease
METKDIQFELKDLNKKEVVFAHAVYDVVDRVGDISRKGMFNKSWRENKSSIGFYLNHNENKTIGRAVEFWEDDSKAYTRAEFGTDKEAKDALELIDNRMISTASFGYTAIRKEFKTVVKHRIRELKEVKHHESSLLTFDKAPANPGTGIISLKSDELQNYIVELNENVDTMEKFCRKSTASDETIISILNHISELKSILERCTTHAVSNETPAPDTVEFANQLYLLNLNF